MQEIFQGYPSMSDENPTAVENTHALRGSINLGVAGRELSHRAYQRQNENSTQETLESSKSDDN